MMNDIFNEIHTVRLMSACHHYYSSNNFSDGLLFTFVYDSAIYFFFSLSLISVVFNFESESNDVSSEICEGLL